MQIYGLVKRKASSLKIAYIIAGIESTNTAYSREGASYRIYQMPRSCNVTELRSFLGMINYYGRFIKNLSSILAPLQLLHSLLQKETTYKWKKG